MGAGDPEPSPIIAACAAYHTHGGIILRVDDEDGRRHEARAIWRCIGTSARWPAADRVSTISNLRGFHADKSKARHGSLRLVYEEKGIICFFSTRIVGIWNATAGSGPRSATTNLRPRDTETTRTRVQLGA